MRLQAVCTWLLWTTSWWHSDAASDSGVYCTSDPSPDYLWLHLKQGKLQEEMETVGPCSPLRSGRSSVRSVSSSGCCSRQDYSQHSTLSSCHPLPKGNSDLKSEILVLNVILEWQTILAPARRPPFQNSFLLECRGHRPSPCSRVTCLHAAQTAQGDPYYSALVSSLRKAAPWIPGPQRVPSAHEDHNCGSKSSKGASA